jgi:23S rRNA (uridine2552-2'-O)-methyltransferase
LAQYQRRDRFFKKAKQERFAARSIYKLEEIDRRHHVIKKGARVVDLGCAPGSWLQYLATAVGPSGRVLGYDIEPVSVSAGPHVQTRVIDVDTLTPGAIRRELAAMIGGGEDPVRVDALLSDMAPKLSGIRDADQARSVHLADCAFQLARALLVEGGVFVAKVFQGRDTDELVGRVKKAFEEVRILKPEATRAGSREVFIVAKGRIAEPAPPP